MLTLKIITTDQDGQTETHLFSGDSIVHREYRTQDHNILSKVHKNRPTAWIIGDLSGSSSEQPFIASDVFIYDKDRDCKNLLFITPKADCFIMDNGKTIDSFFCEFEETPIIGHQE